ncbi:MAG: hypothetical protein LOD91_02805 [Limnochordales bacterium]|nr:hypothetical protein [Limnochordales bacterium]
MRAWPTNIGSRICKAAALALLAGLATLGGPPGLPGLAGPVAWAKTADGAPAAAPEALPPLSVEEIVAQVEAAFAAIRDIELIVEVDQYNATDGSVTPGRGRLQAQLPDLFRFEWLEPDMLAGAILLVDRAQNEARQYNPIREEIIVQQWDRLAAQQNLGPELDRWLSLPDPADYELTVGDIAYNNHQPHYLVLARPRSDPRQLYEFYVHPDTWMISQFRYYDVDGRLALHAVLRDVRINAGLDETLLRTMPGGVVRYR